MASDSDAVEDMEVRRRMEEQLASCRMLCEARGKELRDLRDLYFGLEDAARRVVNGWDDETDEMARRIEVLRTYLKKGDSNATAG